MGELERVFPSPEMAQAIQAVVEIYRQTGVMPEVVVERSRTGFEADARELRAGFYRHADRAVIRPAVTEQAQGRSGFDHVVVDQNGGGISR